MHRHVLTLIIFLFSPLGAAANDNVEAASIRGNLHILLSPTGGNVLLSTGDDGVFIVDDQLSERSAIIDKAIRKISSKDVKFVLNTHYHFDHTGGNEFFGKGGTIILAHDNVRKRLSTKQFITQFKREMAPLSKAGLPVITFNADTTLHYNDDEIRMIHVPSAHTDGDAIAYFTKQNVIVAGDIIFNGTYPFIDTEHGGSIKGVIAALDKILELSDATTIIAAGHGPLMKKEEVRAYRNFLTTIAGKITASIQAGKTLKEVLAEKPTQAFDAAKSGFIEPDAFVKTLYEDLSR